MMKSDEKYQVPAWMRPLLPLLCNTGGNDPEELLNDTETTASANVVRYVLIVAVRSQVDLLQLLYRCVFRSIRSRIGIEVRSAIRIHSINRELNFFYRFLTRFFAAFHYRGIFPQ